MLHEEVELDDTHLCNKCGRTVVGLETYIKHRKVACVPSKPATVTIASGPSPRIVPSEQGYSSFDFGDAIKDADHHKKLPNYGFNYDLEPHHSDPVQRPDSKTDYKNEVNYDYELGADLFFSSLELQSSSKKSGNLHASTSKLNVPIRPKERKSTVSLSNTDPEPEQEHEDDWIAPEHDSEKLMKAVSDISGTKRVELFPFFQHESPEPSEDESEDDEDFDAPPRTHTGGKWKPENRPSSSQWRHWPDQDAQLDKSIEQDDDEDYKSFSPPPGHTKGKWVPGSKITRLEYRVPSFPSKPFDESYWCSICNRKLASRFVYERHLKSNLHIKKAQEESELERAVKPGFYSNELSKRITKPSVYLGDDFFSSNLSPEKSSTPIPLVLQDDPSPTSAKIKRKRKCYYTKCEICKTRLPTHLLGKHLISRYHYRRMLNRPEQCFDDILKNIHRIVLQSPFQCHPCRFYANTEEHFMAHWNSVEHEENVSSGGRLWCSFCKFECSDNFQMTNHLLDQDHQEVISVINRSVPIIIRKITPIRCVFCGDEFRYNAMLNKHHEYCNEGTPEDALRVRRTFQNAFNCNICKASFHNNTLLLQHNQKLHRMATYYCSICEITFKTPNESLKHRKTTAHKVMSARKRKKDAIPPKVCNICKKQLPDILALKDHIRNDHPDIRYSCPQCGQNFVLAQELGRHVRDKNCSFFNSTTSSSTTGAATEAASSMQPDMVVGTLASTSRTHPATTLTTTTTTTPAENSIIPNDSIKVNMNDHKVAKESHLYSSGSKIAPTTAASGAHRAGATSEHGIATLSRAAVDESEAFASIAPMTMMGHYSTLLPSTVHGALPGIETHRVVVTTTHNFLLPGPSPSSSQSSLSAHQPLIVIPTTTTMTQSASIPPSNVDDDDDNDDDNIVTSASTSAEIFFAMANNASENNTVYVDEIVGTTTEGNSVVSWQCKICPFRSNSQAEFLYHEILHSSQTVSTSLGTPDVATKITCPLCKKQFAKASLRCHLRQHTDERIFPCELCPMSFTRKANLKNHMVNVHTRKVKVKEEAIDNDANQTAIVQKPQEPPKSVVCATCGKAFPNRKILSQHAKVHVASKSIKEFACQYENCFYIGHTASEVRTHLLSCHSDERNYVCSEQGCDYRGKTITQLRRHSQRHEETEKKYKCNQCEFATRIPGHLKRHLLVHSGGKPFQCPHCEYSCNNIENLRKHVISTSKHKGKFLYECKYCPATTESEEVYKSNFSKDYRNHLLTHHKLPKEEANQAVRIF
ncbi:zinc finger protein 236 [Aedes aegypti]|uniref:C2H2-type domain-containing protein n=1 Tax=Aedes aegypti TaxID=7159 RepID=A0A6I8TRQ4_AEDAE|nr:zinc finger protein 236 [Aedes aegypti]